MPTLTWGSAAEIIRIFPCSKAWPPQKQSTDLNFCITGVTGGKENDGQGGILQEKFRSGSNLLHGCESQQAMKMNLAFLSLKALKNSA